MRVFDFNAAIVRRPGFSVVCGLSASAGPPPSFDLIAAEHGAYVAALESAGLVVTVLPPLEPFPDSVFVEDPALVFAEAAILLRPGAPTRRDEVDALKPTLEATFPAVLALTDGFADGGDVLVTPGRVLIGLSSRTDAVGAANLQRLLAAIGRRSEVVAVPHGTLHLKSDCSLVDEETVLATDTLARSGILDGFRAIVPPDDERHACNAIRVNDTVFMRTECPRTRELLARHGVDTRCLPAREIAKIDAGLSCMSLRWHRPGKTT